MLLFIGDQIIVKLFQLQTRYIQRSLMPVGVGVALNDFNDSENLTKLLLIVVDMFTEV